MDFFYSQIHTYPDRLNRVFFVCFFVVKNRFSRNPFAVCTVCLWCMVDNWCSMYFAWHRVLDAVMIFFLYFEWIQLISCLFPNAHKHTHTQLHEHRFSVIFERLDGHMIQINEGLLSSNCLMNSFYTFALFFFFMISRANASNLMKGKPTTMIQEDRSLCVVCVIWKVLKHVWVFVFVCA